MQFGFVVPFASERDFVDLARLGEQSGWDAVFSWEGVWRQDAWVQLAAAAMVTSTVRLGTVITPVARYKPWDLASLVGSVDRLSGGRVTMGVGLGAPNSNWLAFEPDEGRKVRAARVDEGLELFAKLCSGEPFRHDGEHFTIDVTAGIEPDGPPPTTQRPHPPVWRVGAYVPERSKQPSLARAARWQGCFPTVADGKGGFGLTQERLREIVEQLRQLRAADDASMEGYDVVVEGDSYGEFDAAKGAPSQWAEAGATWWIESWWDVPPGPAGVAEITRRVAAGPPRN
ncbi:LLM class flavin-dependent oxidoreductase [Calidifontibacter indicus]|uniref:LLM class flavin-dependent oxidoreductase n=1 Tax=Calidifontibacter indicus TaxID=419650 RepID=UPI003D713FE3